MRNRRIPQWTQSRLLRLVFALALSGWVLGSNGFSGRASELQQKSALRYTSQAKYLVLIVLDGARPDYFDVTSLPHLTELRANGVQYTYAMDGILESETPSGHTTISTGTTPRRNGILGFDWEQQGQKYSLFSPVVVRAGAMEHIMTASGVPTIAGLYKAKHPEARVVALSGHKYYAADPLGGPQADAIMYYTSNYKGQYVPQAIPGHVPPWQVLAPPSLSAITKQLRDGQDDALATQLAISALDIMKPRILLINYPDFDWPLGHVYGADQAHDKVVTLMQTFDRDLGLIEDALRRHHILRKTLFVITADHGMNSIYRSIPSTIISKAVAQAGTSVVTASESQGAYVWLRDGAKARVVAENVVRAQSPDIQSVYYLDVSGPTPHYVLAGGKLANASVDAANQYLLATLLNGHEPTLVAFARTGASFASPQIHWKADHGGNGWEAQHIPLVFSGAGVRRGIITGQPTQLDDIAPTVLKAMGVTPVGMDGQVLNDALARPKPSLWAARNAESTAITPTVNALVAQEQFERAHHR